MLIPVNGVLYAFTVEQLAEAQTAALAIMPTPNAAAAPFEPLVDAEAAAALLGISARQLEDYARAGIAPHHRIGRFTRYRPSELAAHFKVDGAPIPTDSQSVTPMRRLSRQ